VVKESPPIADTLRFLLLQVRNDDDPIRGQEIVCFVRSLSCRREQLSVFDLLASAPSSEILQDADIVLLGGSGDYSVATGGPWLPPALAALRLLYDIGKPTFASCWGFQAMAKALGGRVITDPSRAELGSIEVHLTAEGEADSLFSQLGSPFLAQMGHQDRVDRLPQSATRLAGSKRVENQAFCFAGKPIYCTQFHPELNRAALLDRLAAYPWYVEQISGMSFEAFAATCKDTPETDSLLKKFVAQVRGQ